MLRPSEFRELVSGRRRGAAATLLRAGLRCAEVPYTAAVRWRNRRYDAGGGAVHRVGVPVISVGNLTLGGTGKTPMVAWIVQWLRSRGIRPAIVSRGYKAEAGGMNDEALELAQIVPGVPHVQNPDRVAAAQLAIDQFQSQAIVLDDAFQHRRIGRDLDIVLLDALEPFGFGHVFPRGTLREPLEGLRRADVVILSRAGMLDREAREAIRQRVASLAPEAVWAEVTHVPQSLVNFSGDRLPTTSLGGNAVAAFCGIGNPASFRDTLGLCGYRVIGLREYADHYRYARADVETLAAWADRLDADAVLCTQKDLVKLATDRLGRHPLWAVTIAQEFCAGQSEFQTRLQRVIDR